MSHACRKSVWLILFVCSAGIGRADEPVPDLVAAVSTTPFLPAADTALANRRFDDSEQCLQPETVFDSQIGMSPTNPDAGRWFRVAPYGWLPAMKGDVAARGVTADVDSSVSDVIDHLDDLQGALMLHAETGRGSTGLIFDVMYVDLEVERERPLTTLVVDTDLTLAEVLGMYRVVNDRECDCRRPRWTADLLGGVRYYHLQTDVTIDSRLPLPTISAGQNDEWCDLVIGARSMVAVADSVDLFVRGDLGGFAIENSSKLTWNALAGVQCSIPKLPGTSLILGYRVLDIDYANGVGAQAFAFDVRMHGPFAALTFCF